MFGLSRRDSFEPVEETRDISWSNVWGESGRKTWSGMDISRDAALQMMAVHGSVKLISEQISTLPVNTYRWVPGADDTRLRQETESPNWTRQPAHHLDWEQFCSQVLTGLLLDGNSVVQVLRSRRDGSVREMFPVKPEEYEVYKDEDRKTKVILIDGKPRTELDEVIHLTGMMLPGAVEGLSPVEYARQTIGLGLSSLEYGSGYFDRDGNMPGVIQIPKLADPETKRDMARAWRRARTRGGRGLPGILDDGATWQPTGITSEQMQFLETRKFSAAEIAGQMFLIDPTDLGIPIDGSSISYANLDQRNVRRVQVTFLPWLVRLEKKFGGLLPRGQYLKVNVDALLRGDTRSRYDSYKIGVENGWLMPDEVRAKEDMPPLPEDYTAPNAAPEATEDPLTAPGE